MQSELSLIQAAEVILRKHKKPVNIYQLFDESLELTFVKENNKEELVSKFYADLITSALFIYVGDNKWDLKESQKIELWDKDGSHYKEYTVVEMPKEEKPKPKAKAKPVKVEKEKVVEEVVAKEVAKEVVEVVKEEVIEPKEKVVPQVEVVAESKDNDAVENYEEEVFEEYDDDFDEEKYNEYMDTYEDQYDD